MENEKKVLVVCAGCGKEIDIKEAFKFESDYYCDKCEKESFVLSEYSKEVIKLSEAKYLKGVGYVKESEVQFYVKCDECGEYCLQLEATRTRDGKILCEECLLNSYHFCGECEEWVPEDEYNIHEDTCNSCYEERENGIDRILGYHEFSNWRERKAPGDKYQTLLFGFELEVENNSYDYSNEYLAKKVRREFGDLVITAHDGSLDSGFEIISHPMNLNFIYSVKDTIKSALELLQKHTTSENGTCGFHIHINRRFLGATKDIQNETIDKLYLIMETFKDELVKFSRRNANSLTRWSSFLLDKAESSEIKNKLALKNIKDIKERNNGTRYMALNICNRKTVEFRLFRGTLDFTTFMAAFELIYNLVKFAKKSLDKLEGLTWDQLTTANNVIYLPEYVASKNIKSDVILKDYTQEYEAEIYEKYRKQIEEVERINAVANDKIDLLISKFDEVVRPILTTDFDVRRDLLFNYEKLKTFRDLLDRVDGEETIVEVKEGVADWSNFPDEEGINYLLTEIVRSFIVLAFEEKKTIGDMDKIVYRIVDDIYEEIDLRLNMVRDYLA